MIYFPFIALVGGVTTLALLWTAAKNVAPIDLVTFRNKSGMPLFDVIKEENQAKEFDAFIAKLTAMIREPRSS
jgi:hypothetical protein